MFTPAHQQACLSVNIQSQYKTQTVQAFPTQYLWAKARGKAGLQLSRSFPLSPSPALLRALASPHIISSSSGSSTDRKRNKKTYGALRQRLQYAFALGKLCKEAATLRRNASQGCVQDRVKTEGIFARSDLQQMHPSSITNQHWCQVEKQCALEGYLCNLIISRCIQVAWPASVPSIKAAIQFWPTLNRSRRRVPTSLKFNTLICECRHPTVISTYTAFIESHCRVPPD